MTDNINKHVSIYVMHIFPASFFRGAGFFSCYNGSMDKAFIIEVLKILASMIVPIVALLRTRTDLDRFAAGQRAKELGLSSDKCIRKRWYHVLKRKRHGDIR